MHSESSQFINLKSLPMPNIKLFNQIYREEYASVLNYIAFKIQHYNFCKEISEEIANNVFMKVYKHIDTFNPEKASAPTWIRAITNNCIVDFIRSDKSKLNTNISDFVNLETGEEFFTIVSTIETDTETEQNELAETVNNALDSLKPKYKEIAELYFMNELSYNEISSKLEIPLGTVKGMIFRVREMLKSQLETAKNQFILA